MTENKIGDLEWELDKHDWKKDPTNKFIMTTAAVMNVMNAGFVAYSSASGNDLLKTAGDYTSLLCGAYLAFGMFGICVLEAYQS